MLSDYMYSWTSFHHDRVFASELVFALLDHTPSGPNLNYNTF
jgi:hypothetical protein